MDHQYRENGAENISSKYNQMRAYVEYFQTNEKKLYVIDLSIEQSTKLLKILEKCWPFLYLNFTKVLQLALPAHVYKMVITTVCVQIDNCFCST